MSTLTPMPGPLAGSLLPMPTRSVNGVAAQGSAGLAITVNAPAGRSVGDLLICGAMSGSGGSVTMDSDFTVRGGVGSTVVVGTRVASGDSTDNAHIPLTVGTPSMAVMFAVRSAISSNYSGSSTGDVVVVNASTPVSLDTVGYSALSTPGFEFLVAMTMQPSDTDGAPARNDYGVPSDYVQLDARTNGGFFPLYAKLYVRRVGVGATGAVNVTENSSDDRSASYRISATTFAVRL